MTKWIRSALLFGLTGVIVIASGALSVKAAWQGHAIQQDKALGGFSFYLDQYYGSIEGESEVNTTELLAEHTPISSDIAIANVEEKLNIRSGPSTTENIIGYLPKNGICYVKEIKDGWAQITSGNLKGYVAAEYLLYGDSGIKKAREVGVLIADVVAGQVNLRSEPSTDTEDNIIATATKGMELEVLKEVVVNKADEEAALWVMVRYEEDTAYIAKQFVSLSYKWQKAKPAENSVLSHDAFSKSYSSIRNKIAAVAQQYVGLRYSYGGNSLSSGADCSGFILAVLRKCGVDTSHIPRSSSAMAASSNGKTISLSQIQPGDFVFYGNGGKVSHAAVYIGNGKVANMSSVGMKMRIDKVTYRPIIRIKNFLL